MLPSTKIKEGSLNPESILSYGRICKWPYKVELSGTRKRGGSVPSNSLGPNAFGGKRLSRRNRRTRRC